MPLDCIQGVANYSLLTMSIAAMWGVTLEAALLKSIKFKLSATCVASGPSLHRLDDDASL